MAKFSENSNCYIGDGSVFEGRFYVNGSISIEGTFQGEIKTNEELVVGPTGKVKTDITAKKVTIAGTLIGNIDASEEVNLIQTGKILGNIRTPKLTVEPGVVSAGKVTITSDGDGSVENLIKDSFGEDTEKLFSNFVKDKDKKVNKTE